MSEIILKGQLYIFNISHLYFLLIIASKYNHLTHFIYENLEGVISYLIIIITTLRVSDIYESYLDLKLMLLWSFRGV